MDLLSLRCWWGIGLGVGVVGSILRAKCRRLGVLRQGGGPWENSPILSRSFSLFSESLNWHFSLFPHTRPGSQNPNLPVLLVGREVPPKNPAGGRKDVLSDGQSLKSARASDSSQVSFRSSPPHLAHAGESVCMRVRVHTHASTHTISHGLGRQRFDISARICVFLSGPSVADSAINLAVFPCHMA